VGVYETLVTKSSRNQHINKFKTYNIGKRIKNKFTFHDCCAPLHWLPICHKVLYKITMLTFIPIPPSWSSNNYVPNHPFRSCAMNELVEGAETKVVSSASYIDGVIEMPLPRHLNDTIYIWEMEQPSRNIRPSLNICLWGKTLSTFFLHFSNIYLLF